jgi:hypothetical protein
MRSLVLTPTGRATVAARPLAPVKVVASDPWWLGTRPTMRTTICNLLGILGSALSLLGAAPPAAAQTPTE